MINKRIAGVVLVVLLALTVAAVGCRRHATPGEKMNRVIRYLTDDLDLTAEQQEILAQLKADLEDRIKAVRSVKGSVHDEIMTQIKSDVMDQEKVLAAIGTVRVEVGQIISLSVSRLAEFHATLTPEQKQQLVEKLEDLKKLHCDD